MLKKTTVMMIAPVAKSNKKRRGNRPFLFSTESKHTDNKVLRESPSSKKTHETKHNVSLFCLYQQNVYVMFCQTEQNHTSYNKINQEADRHEIQYFQSN